MIWWWFFFRFFRPGGVEAAAQWIRDAVECHRRQPDQLRPGVELAGGGQSRAAAVPAAAVRRRRCGDQHAGRRSRLRRTTVRRHRLRWNRLWGQIWNINILSRFKRKKCSSPSAFFFQIFIILIFFSCFFDSVKIYLKIRNICFSFRVVYFSKLRNILLLLVLIHLPFRKFSFN